MTTRKKPPTFKATIRTKTMRLEMEGPSISTGIWECFLMLPDAAEREALIKRLHNTHEDMCKKGVPA